MIIRACIADDEPLARERIRSLLEGERDIEVVCECSDGGEAVKAIRAHRPALVFLDVQMPVLDGFGVLQTLDPDVPPAVVFVTAYDQYALRAFEVSALDYLLKPFNAERFRRALQRVRADLARAGRSAVNDRLRALLETLRNPDRKTNERIVIKSAGRVSFVKTDELDWVAAEGNYVRLHVGPHSYLLRETMKGLAAKLDPDRFVRIHRSTIVNAGRIRELHPLFHGEYAVILQDGTRLMASRGPENKLRRLLDKAS